MIPFGQTILCWRLHRGLTQQALAAKARVPRSNLSAIERGQREVTLGTLRALAAALETSPGTLADGVAPHSVRRGPLPSSREAIERVADAVAFGRSVADPRERAVVGALGLLLSPRTQALYSAAGARRAGSGRRASRNAWRTLTSLCSREAIATLIDRVTERQAAHGPQAH